MYSFSVKRPSTVAEAQSALSGGGDSSALAGGQTLLPTMKFRLASPEALVDLSGVTEMVGIQVAADSVTVGAMTRHADVAGSAEVAAAIPALASLAGRIGDPAVRNRGTMGGSVANNDPAADYPAAVLGLGATVHTTSRQIAADDFFQGMFETALNEGELITAISFPKPEKAAYAKFPHPASRVAVTGAGPGVFRATAIEAALDANWSPESAGKASVSANGLNSDMHGSAAYRAHLISVMAEDAVRAAG